MREVGIGDFHRHIMCKTGRLTWRLQSHSPSCRKVTGRVVDLQPLDIHSSRQHVRRAGCVTGLRLKIGTGGCFGLALSFPSSWEGRRAAFV